MGELAGLLLLGAIIWFFIACCRNAADTSKKLNRKFENWLDDNDKGPRHGA